ncbi:MAG: roadblock/LC7 domain-containing protein [Bacteriovoracaceae bacterium]|nr:roadblock/LC7 domain-containing protein [Bacteriovoracaceae bacterium]
MNFTNLVKEFFVENEFNLISDRVALVRNDGTVMYANSLNSLESSNIGALASGIWQAAQSLSSLVNKDAPQSGYRLSFDTSSEGIYLLPLTLDNIDCYFCCIFKDQINPAKLKQNMRNIGFLLETYIRDESLNFKRPKPSIEQGYLFKNITDQEMDQLFGFTGN